MERKPMTRMLLVCAVAVWPACVAGQSLFHAPLGQPRPRPDQQAAPAAAPAPAAPGIPGGTGGGGSASPAGQPAGGEPSSAPPGGEPAAPQGAPAAAPVAGGVESAGYGSARMAPTAGEAALFAVKPIKPRKFNKNDKVEIIVNETNLSKFEQKGDTKESGSVDAQLKALPSLEALLQDLVVRNTGTPSVRLGATNSGTYKGQGTYERKERMTARISAVVTDVKPNGMLVLEARETVLSDRESKSMVVSGLCDPRDITNRNTVESSQLANLVIKTEHAGDVKDGATKGWGPRLFEFLSGVN